MQILKLKNRFKALSRISFEAYLPIHTFDFLSLLDAKIQERKTQ